MERLVESESTHPNKEQMLITKTYILYSHFWLSINLIFNFRSSNQPLIPFWNSKKQQAKDWFLLIIFLWTGRQTFHHGKILEEYFAQEDSWQFMKWWKIWTEMWWSWKALKLMLRILTKREYYLFILWIADALCIIWVSSGRFSGKNLTR